MSDLSLAVAGLPEREQHLILRSACHVADENRLPESLRFCNQVTDLDVARLLHAIERGTIVVARNAAWVDLEGTLRARMPHLTRVVRECLRLGLVRQTSRELVPDVWRTWLVAAPVHLVQGGRPACGALIGRPRLSDDIGLIDCRACLKPDR